MPATFNWNQTVGAPPGQSQNLGQSGNLVNFKGIDSIGTSDYGIYPIPAGNNSYEVWLRGSFSGTFNSIRDLRFWMSTPFSPSTGLVVKAKTDGQDTYGQPTNQSSSIALDDVSDSDPGQANVSIGGNLNGSLLAAGYSDYVVMQLQTTGAALAGDTSLASFSLSYIET